MTKPFDISDTINPKDLKPNVLLPLGTNIEPLQVLRSMYRFAEQMMPVTAVLRMLTESFAPDQLPDVELIPPLIVGWKPDGSSVYAVLNGEDGERIRMMRAAAAQCDRILALSDAKLYKRFPEGEKGATAIIVVEFQRPGLDPVGLSSYRLYTVGKPGEKFIDLAPQAIVMSDETHHAQWLNQSPYDSTIPLPDQVFMVPGPSTIQ